MQKHHPRMFIGLDLAAQDKIALAQWRDNHLHGLPDKPVPMENFHITLSFLGQVPPEKMEILEQKLTQFQAQALRLSSSDLGSFIKAKILYLGIVQDPNLSELARQCLSINSALGLPQHHQVYRPHITLTRKHKEVVPIVAAPPKLDLHFDQFHLFESISSHVSGKPPHYPKRMSFDLMPSLKPELDVPHS